MKGVQLLLLDGYLVISTGTLCMSIKVSDANSLFISAAALYLLPCHLLLGTSQLEWPSPDDDDDFFPCRSRGAFASWPAD